MTAAGYPEGTNGRRLARELAAAHRRKRDALLEAAERVAQLDPDSRIFEASLTFATANVNLVETFAGFDGLLVSRRITRAVDAEPACEGVLG